MLQLMSLSCHGSFLRLPADISAIIIIIILLLRSSKIIIITEHLLATLIILFIWPSSPGSSALLRNYTIFIQLVKLKSLAVLHAHVLTGRQAVQVED